MSFYINLSFDNAGWKQFQKTLKGADSANIKLVEDLLASADIKFANKGKGKTFIWNDIDWKLTYGINDASEFEKAIYDDNAGMTFIDLCVRKIPARHVLFSREENEPDQAPSDFLPEVENIGELEYELTEREEKTKNVKK